jgi:RsiW-degrading membrane proteinase PrsW (M82 family)
MEWKEHVAWLVPISITMAFAVFNHYRRNLRNHPELRATVLSFMVVSFLAAGIAGFFGAMLNKHAPVEGGPTIRVMEGESR